MRWTRTGLALGGVAGVVFLGAPGALADDAWDARFSPPGVRAGMVKDAVVYDDGNGPKLYVCGSFNQINGLPVKNIARWDGTKWESVLGGISGECRSMAVYDLDGPSGPEQAVLVIGGVFTNAFNTFTSSAGVTTRNIVAYDGTQWQSMGGLSGVNQWVNDLAVCDFGSGPRLMAGGSFTIAGGSGGYGHIAIWDGFSWSEMPNGGGASAGPNSASITSLYTFNDGSGEAVYITGSFTTLDTVSVPHGLAKFDGSNVTDAGWVSPNGERPWALGSCDFDGAGPNPAELVTSGITGPANAGEIHAWNGSSWRVIAGPEGMLPVSMVGLGSDLYVNVGSVYKYNGSAWSLVGGALTTGASSLVAGGVVTVADVDLDGPGGPALFTGGSFRAEASGNRMDGYAYLNAVGAWETLPAGPKWGASGPDVVKSILIGDPDGIGGLGEAAVICPPAETYVGPSVTGADFDGPRVFDGAAFASVATPPVPFSCVRLLDLDGAGPMGTAIVGFGTSAYVWNGAAWGLMFPGASEIPLTVADAEVFDPDGSGPLPLSVVVGGFGGSELGVMRWDGAAWVTLGTGLTPTSSGQVRALEVFDDGSGAALFAAGPLVCTDTGGGTVRGIAKFAGGVWTGLGTGTGLMQGAGAPDVNDLCVYDVDGSGPLGAQLVMGGTFTRVNSETDNARSVASWDGVNLQAFGGAMTLGTNTGTAAPIIYDLHSIPFGAGDELTVAGNMKVGTGAGAIRGVARHDAATNAWVSLGDGSAGELRSVNLSTSPATICYAIAGRVEGDEVAYYIGGTFNQAGEVATYGLARFTKANPNACAADFNGSGAVSADDIFAFLDAWFAQTGQSGANLSADFNGSGTVTADDIFAFLDAWFGGC